MAHSTILLSATWCSSIDRQPWNNKDSVSFWRTRQQHRHVFKCLSPDWWITDSRPVSLPHFAIMARCDEWWQLPSDYSCDPCEIKPMWSVAIIHLDFRLFVQKHEREQDRTDRLRELLGDNKNWDKWRNIEEWKKLFTSHSSSSLLLPLSAILHLLLARPSSGRHGRSSLCIDAVCNCYLLFIYCN